MSLRPRLSAEKATRVYERVDRPLVPVLAQMEREGIKVDRDELARMSAEFAEGCAGFEAEIHELAGQNFAVGSPKQLGEILFGKMGLKGGKKGKSGDYSTDVTVLEKLAEEGVDGRLVGRQGAPTGVARRLGLDHGGMTRRCQTT